MVFTCYNLIFGLRKINLQITKEEKDYTWVYAFNSNSEIWICKRQTTLFIIQNSWRKEWGVRGLLWFITNHTCDIYNLDEWVTGNSWKLKLYVEDIQQIWNFFY